MRSLINDGWVFTKFAAETSYEDVVRLLSEQSGEGAATFTCVADTAGTTPPVASTGANDRIRNQQILSRTRPVDLPHDWMIYDTNNLYQSSVGVYERTLMLDASKANSIYFEGVYMRTSIYLNGQKIFFWPYGYTSFEVDLTPYQQDGANHLLVYVDYRSPNTRWYSGAGIYRDVYLLEKEPVHIAENSIYFHAEAVDREMKPVHADDGEEADTDVGAEADMRADSDVGTKADVKADSDVVTKAGVSTVSGTDYKVTIEAEIVNSRAKTPMYVTIVHTLIDMDGNEVKQCQENAAVEGDLITVVSDFTVATPKLWDIDSPYLYTLITSLYKEEKLLDSFRQQVGFRTILFTPDEGFFLNGRHVKINGACQHHDLGALGAAFNKKAARRQIEKLKAIGINAIRTSHNPPAVGLMELADEMGILIDSDAFDMWEMPKTEYDYGIFFHEWCEKDVEAWVKRDRNHPSVIMWSCGNEIPDTNDIKAVEIAERLCNAVRRFDSRHNAYTTIASNYVAWENAQKSQAVFELSGYNYLERVYDEHHERFPDWCIYGSETASTVQSRGIYHFPRSNRLLTYEDGQCSSLDNCSTNWGAASVQSFIKNDRDRGYSAGQFIWTGWDYIGEPTPYFSKNSFFGHIDTAGFYKDTAYIIKSAWVPFEKEPFVHISPYWDFNEGQLIDVEIYSNAPNVALFLNGEKIGEKELDPLKGEDFAAHFQIPYVKGWLRAEAYDDKGNVAAVDEAPGFGDPVSIKLKAEYDSIAADGEDLQFVQISVLDKDGNEVRNARNRINLKVAGPARLVGMDNGDSTDYDQYKTCSRKLFSGKLIAIIAPTLEAGEITVEAVSCGLESASLTFASVPGKPRKGVAFTESVECSGVSLGEPKDNYREELLNTLPDNKEYEIPVRKLEISSISDGYKGVLSPECSSAEFSVRIYPENATYDDILIKAMTLDGIESSAVKIDIQGGGPEISGEHSAGRMNSREKDSGENSREKEVKINKQERAPGIYRQGDTVRVTAVSDGELRLMACAGNGKDHPEVISELEMSVQGFGNTALDAYSFVYGCQYSYSKEAALLSFRGSVNFGDGNIIRFDNVDFGSFGSDKLVLSLFSFRDEEAVEIWDGEPDVGELLCKDIYRVPTEYNVLQEYTFSLSKRLRGVRSIVFRFEHGFVLGGFRMIYEEKAYALIKATDHQMITGDRFKERVDGIYSIGNNVDIEFRDLDMNSGVSAVTITGRANGNANPIHIRFFDGEDITARMVEFPESESIQTITFPLESFRGNGKVNFIFLPGSDFDFIDFKFVPEG